MAKWLSDADGDKIVEAILSWPLWKPFGWEKIRQEIQTQKVFPELHEVWTRQQLQKYPNIKNAYRTKITQIRANKGRHRNKDVEDLPPRERAMKEQVEAYRAKVKHLTDMIDGFHEMFERHIYNASIKGMTREMLEMPLPMANEDKKYGK